MRLSTTIGFVIGCVALPTQAVTTDVVCSYAPSQSNAVKAITAAAGGAAAGSTAILSAAGLSAVAHSSGGYILTGSGGYIAGTLGGAAAGPFLITVGVVVAGSAVALEMSCAPKNHPDSLKAVKYYNDIFLRETNGKLSDWQKQLVEKVRDTNNQLIDARDASIEHIRAANSIAIEYRENAFGYFSR